MTRVPPSTWLVVTLAATVLAVWLAVAPPRRVASSARGRGLGVLVVPGVAAGPLLVAGVGLALAVIVAAAALGARALWRGRQRRQAVERGQVRVLGFCQLLAGELAAGQPPGQALERAAVDWPELAPVAAALRLGGDVPAALRAAADEPGHGDLMLAAAAWQVAHHAGAGLANALARVTDGLRATQRSRRLVAGELASARATARLMAGLPVLVLAMGSGIGGNPVSFLLGTPAGLACLGGGLAFGFTGLWWIERIADGVAAEAT